MNHAKKIAVIAALLLLGACRGPKIIPDDELALVFHDIYLVDAYLGQENIRIDSLNIYEPVFARHGYAIQDVQYTIGNFAKRKSARLSDVVDKAAAMLDGESRYYRRRIEIRDTIALIAKKRYAETVYSDSLIRVRRTADTALLRIVIPDIRMGSYEVAYNYLLDSLDSNSGLRGNIWLVDSAGRRSGNTTRRLAQAVRSRVDATLDAGDGQRFLVLSIGGYPEKLTTPNLTVDSLRVTYYLPDEEAVARLSHGRMTGRLDSLINPRHETHLVPPLVDTLRP